MKPAGSLTPLESAELSGPISPSKLLEVEGGGGVGGGVGGGGGGEGVGVRLTAGGAELSEPPQAVSKAKVDADSKKVLRDCNVSSRPQL